MKPVVIINNKDDIFKKLNEISIILINLRNTTDFWNTKFGGSNREKMVYWEKKADEWINNNIKIENSP